MLPLGWRPPTSFPVVVHYRERGRDPDTLWVTPYNVLPDGQVRYLATGPAGQRLDASTVAAIDNRWVPAGAVVVAVTETHEFGHEVFAQLNHTAN